MADLLSVRAVARGVDQAPRKVSLVASLVRGRSIDDALTILQHTPKRSAKAVAKTIASAKANAVNTHGLNEKTLVLQSIQVTCGPRLKRFKPAAMGRALPFQKKSSHITVVVAGEAKIVKKPVKAEKKEQK